VGEGFAGDRFAGEEFAGEIGAFCERTLHKQVHRGDAEYAEKIICVWAKQECSCYPLFDSKLRPNPQVVLYFVKYSYYSDLLQHHA
jgi:hypothetical protein